MSGRRGIDPRRIRDSRTYLVRELAKLAGRDIDTVLGWIRTGGLPTISARRPLLIDGREFKRWLADRSKSRRGKCPQNHLYCLRCRAPRQAQDASAKIGIGRRTAKITAVCQSCGTTTSRFVSLRDVSAWRDLATSLSCPEGTLVKDVSPRLNGGFSEVERLPATRPVKATQIDFGF